ncbi:MAG: hypothetical protein IJ626_00905, partial [Muribaculaceae bacterium]|nr:hypothetical protein [Muribaculaceae bacterium]
MVEEKENDEKRQIMMRKMRYKAKIKAIAVMALMAVALMAQMVNATNVHYFFLSEPGKVFP